MKVKSTRIKEAIDLLREADELLIRVRRRLCKFDMYPAATIDGKIKYCHLDIDDMVTLLEELDENWSKRDKKAIAFRKQVEKVTP